MEAQRAVLLSHGCSLKRLKKATILCFSKLLASWFLAKSLSKSEPSRMPVRSFCKFLSFEKDQELLFVAAFVRWWSSFWTRLFDRIHSKIENIYGTMYTQI